MKKKKTDIDTLLSRVVNVGGVPLGGQYPLRIQSMTNVSALDTAASVKQILSLAEAGCEFVRLAVPTIKDAENLKNIRASLKRHSCNVPLIADVHFTPEIALTAARLVEKVRINPGNFTDRDKKENIFNEQDFIAESLKAHKRFVPLLNVCKEHGTALRIGVNHGSLSSRMISRYGNTPEGMVESALEFADFCINENFHEFVFSLKASNVRLMVNAYRLLVQEMKKRNINYPLHLGLTEAGSGDEGLIKSCVALGTLLEDGIGDTIRVSLTGDPVQEMPVAITLAKLFPKQFFEERKKRFFAEPKPVFEKRTVLENFRAHPLVIADFRGVEYIPEPDLYFINDIKKAKESPYLPAILKYQHLKLKQEDRYPYYPSFEVYMEHRSSLVPGQAFVESASFNVDEIDILKRNRSIILVLIAPARERFSMLCKTIHKIREAGCNNAIVIKAIYSQKEPTEACIRASAELGSIMLDYPVDGIWIGSGHAGVGSQASKWAFQILQATGLRISTPEYISCPTCGRTSYDVVKALETIKEKTKHLKGIKIAIMGCVVNGPGEMADADFGYVGTTAGKINLYKGKEVINKNISPANAIGELIELIKDSGMWTDPR
ncbi:MAG: (E)-4-hydroxy-3-methylbut-2-enyl-diphosphate synthase [Bacteroidota bacterium]